jgi:hypothetical protein
MNDQFAAALFDANIGDDVEDPDDLRGGKRAQRRFVEWSNFFQTGDGTPQNSKRIDTTLSSPLFALPFIPPNMPGNPRSLAQRNLLRHLTFCLPSGQSVAKAMRIDPLDPKHLDDIASLGMNIETPLWFYILREADRQAGGKTLGPVGGRIVAEIFIGLLEGDRMSYIRQNPCWTPTLGSKKGEFRIADLLKFAGV